MLDNGMILVDRDCRSYGTLIRAERVLHDQQSPYQRIMVVETENLGRVLMLDGIFNVSPVMEAHYHEPMAHIPVAMAQTPERCLIIGGGDFGVAHHLIKHEGLRRITLCELDPEILTVCRRYFPQWAACESDRRLEVRVGDGLAYLRDADSDSLDLIIVDSTDPYLGAGNVLISNRFYRHAVRALRPGGVLMQIVADFLFYRRVWAEVLPRATRHFDSVSPLFLPIPFYATGNWGFLLAGKAHDHWSPDRISTAFLNGIGGVETLTAERVRGWFSLPPYVAGEIGGLLP